jgi:uncharacterized protein (TIGR02118 family)
MYKLVILIESTSGDPLIQETWPRFLRQAENMPGLRRESTSHVDHVVFGEFPYRLIHELYFDSMEATQSAMASEAGKAAGRLLQSMTQGKLTLFFADHKEDAAENLLKFREPDQDE